jgi:hypothetical protein
MDDQISTYERELRSRSLNPAKVWNEITTAQLEGRQPDLTKCRTSHSDAT